MGAAAPRCAASPRPDESSPEQVSEGGARAVSGRCPPAPRPGAARPSRAGGQPAAPGCASLPSAPRCARGSPRLLPFPRVYYFCYKTSPISTSGSGGRGGRRREAAGGGRPVGAAGVPAGLGRSRPGAAGLGAAPRLGWAPPPPPARWFLGEGRSPGPTPPLPLQGAGGPARAGRMW